MELFSMLPQNYTQKIANEIGLSVSTDYNSPDVITLIVRKNKVCGVDDPTKFIVYPPNCIVFAGTIDETGIAFSEQAAQAGVPEDNILLLPKGQPLSLKILIDKIIDIQHNILTPKNSEDVLYFEDDLPNSTPSSTSSRVKVIAVTGFRGGVGTSTIASSLAALLHENNGRIALVDLGMPPNAKYHSGTPTFNEKDGFLLAQCKYCDLYSPSEPVWEQDPESLGALIDILRKEYRWVVVDFFAQPEQKYIQAVGADITVVVMDSDIIQSVEPAGEIQNALFIYNKAIADIGSDVFEDILGGDVITINTDFEGCYAALAAGEPAYNKSEDIAIGIGKLATKLQSRE